MDENDKILLQLYKKDIIKKKIIVFFIILIFLGVISLYYFYINLKQPTKENSSNYIEINSNSDELKNTNAEGNNNLTNENINLMTNENELTEDTVNKEKTEEKQEQTIKDTNVEKKEDTSNIDNNKKETTEEVTKVTTEKPKNKDFLFTDGYTMENVTKAAEDYLKSYDFSGECIPIQDDEGIYLGMRVIFY